MPSKSSHSSETPPSAHIRSLAQWVWAHKKTSILAMALALATATWRVGVFAWSDYSAKSVQIGNLASATQASASDRAELRGMARDTADATQRNVVNNAVVAATLKNIATTVDANHRDEVQRFDRLDQDINGIYSLMVKQGQQTAMEGHP